MTHFIADVFEEKHTYRHVRETAPIRTKEQAEAIRAQLEKDMRRFKRQGGRVYKARTGESALPDKAMSYFDKNNREKLFKQRTQQK